jgi:quinol-cytochrome oxidoreductase complex cytochrome b subunit
VVLMGLSIAIFLVLPILSKPAIKTLKFRPVAKIFYWLFICDVILLM